MYGNKNERLGWIRQTNRHFCLRHVPEILDTLRVVEADFAIAIIDRDSEMPQEIVSQVAINPRVDCLSNVAKIDNAYIDVL